MDISSGSVLGVDYFGPVEGSPLVPPDILTLYFALFLLFLTTVYLILRFKNKKVGIKQRLKKIVFLAIFIKFFVLLGVGGLTAYWFIPAPNVVKTIPLVNSDSASTTQKIEIAFDRPVSRKVLEKSISPELPGVWIFEKSFYRTHLFKRVAFYPTQSLKPNTEYKITLSNITNSAGISKPYTHQFSFKTQPDPDVLRITPKTESEDVSIDSKILVTLTNPNDYLAEFDFEFEPNISFEKSLDKTKLIYELKFNEALKQGTKYVLNVKKTNIAINPQTYEILFRDETKQNYTSTFTTKSPPGIESIFPTGAGIAINTPITLNFSTKMDKKSVEDRFEIEPKVQGNLIWSSDKTLEFKAQKLDYETIYKIKVKKGAKSLDGGYFENDSEFEFLTIGPVKVTTFNPENNWKGVSIIAPIRINFDQEVNKISAQESFSITPKVEGSFSWDKNTLIFTPSQKLTFSTKYLVKIENQVKSIRGLASNSEFSSLFTTQDAVVKLAVPAYLQQHALSCELAALKMALAYKGINVSEETLLSEVGVDNTPHQENIWGNPYSAFVGNVDGKQMVDGYGVYWGPIARVARNYKDAQEFEGWSINQLTDAILAGNPVVIWVYAGSGIPTSWNTPSGQNIKAFRDEHAVIAVGFVGKADNPTQLIINDPLIGQVYWSRSIFDKKWESFGESGVVII